MVHKLVNMYVKL